MSGGKAATPDRRTTQMMTWWRCGRVMLFAHVWRDDVTSCRWCNTSSCREAPHDWQMPDKCSWRRYAPSDIFDQFRDDLDFGIHRNISVPVLLLLYSRHSGYFLLQFQWHPLWADCWSCLGRKLQQKTHEEASQCLALPLCFHNVLGKDLGSENVMLWLSIVLVSPSN